MTEQWANHSSTDCMKTQQCAPLKHHYDECAERVQHQQETNGKADEDCVEECKFHHLNCGCSTHINLIYFTNGTVPVFHLMHCASQCAAPKLFKQLR